MSLKRKPSKNFQISGTIEWFLKQHVLMRLIWMIDRAFSKTRLMSYSENHNGGGPALIELQTARLNDIHLCDNFTESRKCCVVQNSPQLRVKNAEYVQNTVMNLYSFPKAKEVVTPTTFFCINKIFYLSKHWQSSVWGTIKKYCAFCNLIWFLVWTTRCTN